MKLKINYTFFGGSSSSSNTNNESIEIKDEITFSDEHIGSLDRSRYNFKQDTTNLTTVQRKKLENENISVNDLYKQYFRFDDEVLKYNPCVTVSNLGAISQDRHGIDQGDSYYTYGLQCMYISIYDYLILKKRIPDLSFTDFRDSYSNIIKTDPTSEFDSNIKEHRNNLRRLAIYFDLDIRVWDKNPTNNCISYNKSDYYKNIQTNPVDNNEYITYNFRRGAGNSNIVNILSHGFHFDLIIGGSDFTPLFTQEEYNTFSEQSKSNMIWYPKILRMQAPFLEVPTLDKPNDLTYDDLFNKTEKKDEFNKNNLEFQKEQIFVPPKITSNDELIAYLVQLDLLSNANVRSFEDFKTNLDSKIKQIENDREFAEELVKESLAAANFIITDEERERRRQQEENDRKMAEDMQENVDDQININQRTDENLARYLQKEEYDQL